MERDDFKKRADTKSEISLLELFYPLLQGYDSVVLKADVELGGSDQKFNLIVSRAIQRRYGQNEEVILTMPLLVGTDGSRKMSKSYGNHIPIQSEAGEMFGKIMSIPDELMWDYYTLLSETTPAEIEKRRSINPKDAKMLLAKEIVTRFHDRAAAETAMSEFERIFSRQELPSDIETVNLPLSATGYPLVTIMTDHGLTSSKGEARRMIIQRAVRVEGERVEDHKYRLDGAVPGEFVIQVGKRRFRRFKIG